MCACGCAFTQILGEGRCPFLSFPVPTSPEMKMRVQRIQSAIEKRRGRQSEATRDRTSAIEQQRASLKHGLCPKGPQIDGLPPTDQTFSAHSAINQLSTLCGPPAIQGRLRKLETTCRTSPCDAKHQGPRALLLKRNKDA